MSQAPTLETERLVLSAHAPGDLAAAVALWSDPQVVRFIGGRVSTREETWSRLLRYAGLWAMTGCGYWAIREKASGRFVGDVGFADFQREIDPPFGGAPEGGWSLAPWSHGRGYATEAVKAALAWADAHLQGPRTVCMIDPDNAASLAVAAKVGYLAYAKTLYRGLPIILFERRAGG